jgi:hypothetical protein
MTAITFDAHKFVQKLKEAGLTEKQAEGISDAFRDAQTDAQVVTKLDIKELEVKISETKAEMIRWIVGAGFLQTALIAALLMRMVR